MTITSTVNSHADNYFYKYIYLFQFLCSMKSVFLLKSDSHRPKKKLCYLLDWKPFKNDEKRFLFQLESSFRSQDILVFVTTFHKSNQTMKFGQLIEYNKKNIFLQKLCRKWGKETSSQPLFIF